MRVILFESRTRTRHELVGMLTEMTHDVTGCASAETALQTIEEAGPEAVIIGDTGPELSVRDFARQLRRLPGSADFAVLALTANDDAEDGLAHSIPGVDDFITLPISEADLQTLLERSHWEKSREFTAEEIAERLQKPGELVMALFEHATDGYFVADRDGRIIAANSVMETLTGYPVDELRGETVPGLGLALDHEPASAPDPDDDETPVTFKVVTKEWRHVPVEMQRFDIRLAGQPCMIGVLRDISRQQRAIKAQTSSLLKSVARDVSDVICLLAPDGTVQFISPGIQDLLGYKPDDLVDSLLVDLIDPDDRAEFQSILALGEGAQPVEVRLQHSDGTWRDLKLGGSDHLDNPMVEGTFVVIRPAPISAARPAAAEIGSGGFYSIYDPVTALPNRMLFLDRLDHAMERAARYQHLVGVLVISIDDFTPLAERLNYQVDQLLAEISQRLHQALRDGDTAARIGDDEFAVLAEGIGGAAEGRTIAERISENLRAPFIIGTEQITITISSGIAVSSPNSRNAGNLLRDGQAALGYARKQGGARHVVFQNRMREGLVNTHDLQDDLKRALDRQELQLYYQPEVDLASGAIVGAEALVRWEHPRHGLILPGEFIAIAEETGLIIPIGGWILARACQQMSEWLERYPAAKTMVIGVNLSPLQFRQPEFVASVATALMQAKLEPTHLRLEIAGDVALHNAPHVIAAFRELRELGVHVAIQEVDLRNWQVDDLENLPADTIKIDRSAVGGVVADHERPSQTQPLASIARAMGMSVVVAGIETANHLARARIFRHERGQGYYFFRPVPAQTMDFILSRGGDPDAIDQVLNEKPLSGDTPVTATA